MTAHYDTEATAAGIDASRRVAWARYYAAIEDARAAQRHTRHMMRHLARLALDVEQSEAVRVFEPETQAAARRVLAALRARSVGRAVLDEMERRAP
jgi:hypothetical protein